MSDTIQTLSEGDYAPDFTLDDEKGKPFTLSSARGKRVVLYFYPKDDTPGCTTEAKDFTQLMGGFERENTLVVGVSRDDQASHAAFCAKHSLEVTLVSDTDNTVCEAYDCWVEKNMYGKKYMGVARSTFLIDEKGIVRKIWRKVKVNGHADSVLETIRALDT